MAVTLGTQLPSHQQHDLDANLRRVWGLGANLIVGWRFQSNGIDVLYLPSYDLPKVSGIEAELLQFDREIRAQGQLETLKKSGCKLSRIALAYQLNREQSVLDFINHLVRKYSVTYHPCRAVALFDMVSFSIHSPFQQITQINVLSHYIKLAAQRCRHLGMPIDVCMTTTGDGFYVWNERSGVMADIALYNATLLALTYNYVSRDLATTESVPRLRCVIHFGSHYEYFQNNSSDGPGSAFIVGDVTVNAARLISQARTNQLLIGAYTRDLDADNEDRKLSDLLGTSSLDAFAFMAMAQEETAKLAGLPVPGGKIERINAYLTGPRVSDDAFAIRKYYITDKHGLEHGCYNAKLNVTTSQGDKVFFGLLDKDLKDFKARADEDEDILIRMR
ncbi:MAG: hypothetical protein RIB59_01560 [Rhodospirillales bacterium]